MTIIHDGRGSGSKAGVNRDGQVSVEATDEAHISYISRTRQQAFELHPPSWTLTQASGHTAVIWMKNISSTKNFHVEHVRLDWNGGSTNFNRNMGFRTYVNMAEPTANATTGQFGASPGPHNLNLASNVEPEIDFRFWDAVGTTGMTVSSMGNQINCGMLGQGNLYLPYHGALILPPQAILGVSLVASEENGKGAAVITGFFIDLE